MSYTDTDRIDWLARGGHVQRSSTAWDAEGKPIEWWWDLTNTGATRARVSFATPFEDPRAAIDEGLWQEANPNVVSDVAREQWKKFRERAILKTTP